MLLKADIIIMCMGITPKLEGEGMIVEFKVAPDAFSVIDEQNKRVIKPGLFEFTIGGSQPDTNNRINKSGILKAGMTVL